MGCLPACSLQRLLVGLASSCGGGDKAPAAVDELWKDRHLVRAGEDAAVAAAVVAAAGAFSIGGDCCVCCCCCWPLFLLFKEADAAAAAAAISIIACAC